MKTLQVFAAVCVLPLIVSCSGSRDLAEPFLPGDRAELHPAAFVSDVGQNATVSVSCADLFGLRCTVEWSGNEIFDDAVIYRSTVNDFATATEVGREWASWHGFEDTDVVSGTRYYYWVRFEDDDGNRSPVSASASACPARFGAPAACSSPTAPIGPGAEPTTATVAPEKLPFLRQASETRYQAVAQPRLVTGARQAPVYSDGLHLFVGVDQGVDAINALEAAGTSTSSSSRSVATPAGSYQTTATSRTETTISERSGFQVRHAHVSATVNRGGASERLASYLEQAAYAERVSDGTPLVIRYPSPPTVRFGDGATEEDVDRLLRAVQLVNSALPVEWRLQMPSGVPSTEAEAHQENGIWVEFVPEADFRGEASDSLGVTRTSFNLADGSIPNGSITINKAYTQHGERGAVTVLAHELIHALGLGHVPASFRTIMAPILDTTADDMPLSILYPIDREALRALYGRMESGDTATAFGDWEDTTTYLLGNNDHAAFGIAWRNGYAEPWAYGYIPETDLVDNPALFGTATWEGLLLGFTPNENPVSGSAELDVHLDDLTGQARFDDLESWPVSAAPGAAGTGDRWGDGDLRYTSGVTGNTFVQTGGDEGFVTGAFFGEEHEAVGGTLERIDLTAAFAGTRE